MTKAKAKKSSRRPLRKAVTTEDQGIVHPHKAQVYQTTPTKGPEDVFATAATALLESKIKGHFAIIRGIINLEGLPSNDFILQATNRRENDTADPRESLTNEVARRTIQVSATYFPEVYTPLAASIRGPIERCMHHLNEVNNANPRLLWNDRQLRDPGTSTLIFSFPVPAEEAHMVQFRHLDFISGQRKCISCHIGLSDGIRLQIYDEINSRWIEVTYGRGDILLVRGDKFHRGTNYAGPDVKIRSFLYIEDEAYVKELQESRHVAKGAVFSSGLKDMDSWYKRQTKLATTSSNDTAKETKASKKAARERRIAELVARNKEYAK